MRVGLTGGIGSGKSTVARYFMDLGVPVYNSDRRARELMEHDKDLKRGIEELLGKGAYSEGGLNRPYIATRVFREESLLKKLNKLVHPAVRADFNQWADRQETPYVLQEAAILIENGAYKDLDRTILVTAPEKERIDRVMKRDSVSEEAVRLRMQNQWGDMDKIPMADYVLENTDLQATVLEVGRIHRELLQIAGI
jgi:dephospho-CoA kinase